MKKIISLLLIIYLSGLVSYATIESPNGTYYIRNKQTEYYADIQGPTMADGTTIHQWQFHGKNSQRWIFEHQGDGFYTIRSANSTTPYYLGVINDEVVVNSDIVLRDDDITGGMLWNVSVTDSGAFKLTAQKGYALDYALATTTSDQTNGAKLIHGAYVDNNSYRDEWYLHDKDYFTEALTDVFGFDASEAAILEDMYYRVRDAYPNESYTMLAWKYSRLLSGLYYDKQLFGSMELAWNDVAGVVIPFEEDVVESDYFMYTLGYTFTEYDNILNIVTTQHNAALNQGESDFAHFNMALAARLAYKLREDGILSNILGTNEDVSYLAGWLGDATLESPPSLKNDDYKSDLDAENIFRILNSSNVSYLHAVNSYYYDLYVNNESRADIFLTHISYSEVKDKIFNRIVDEEYLSESDEYKLNLIRYSHSDTYNFILALGDRLKELGG